MSVKHKFITPTTLEVKPCSMNNGLVSGTQGGPEGCEEQFISGSASDYSHALPNNVIFLFLFFFFFSNIYLFLLERPI